MSTLWNMRSVVINPLSKWNNFSKKNILLSLIHNTCMSSHLTLSGNLTFCLLTLRSIETCTSFCSLAVGSLNCFFFFFLIAMELTCYSKFVTDLTEDVQYWTTFGIPFRDIRRICRNELIQWIKLHPLVLPRELFMTKSGHWTPGLLWAMVAKVSNHSSKLVLLREKSFI